MDKKKYYFKPIVTSQKITQFRETCEATGEAGFGGFGEELNGEEDTNKE